MLLQPPRALRGCRHRTFCSTVACSLGDTARPATRLSCCRSPAPCALSAHVTEAGADWELLEVPWCCQVVQAQRLYHAERVPRCGCCCCCRLLWHGMAVALVGGRGTMARMRWVEAAWHTLLPCGHGRGPSGGQAGQARERRSQLAVPAHNHVWMWSKMGPLNPGPALCMQASTAATTHRCSPLGSSPPSSELGGSGHCQGEGEGGSEEAAGVVRAWAR